MYRKSLAALCAVLAFSSFNLAYAADMPIKAPPLPIALSGSGFYLGVNGGAAAADQQYQFITLPGTATSAPGGVNGKLFPAGIMGGATVGFGGSVGGLYAAIETDYDYDVAHAETTCAYGAVSSRCGMHNSWLLSQRLVLGVPLSGITGAIGKVNTNGFTPPSQWPIPITMPATLSASNLMPFITAGIAERNVSAYVDPTGTPPVAPSKKEGLFPGASGQEWLIGYIVGGGLRLPLATGWTAKAEYDFIGFNKSFVPSNAAAGLFPSGTAFKTVSEQRLVMGLDYHF